MKKFAEICKNNKKTRALIVFILFVMGCLVYSKGNSRDLCIWVRFSFLINMICWIWILHIEIKKRAYSLNLMHWLFCVFFFAFAPLVQYSVGSFPWIWNRSDEILLRANILLFVWTVAVLCGNKLCTYKSRREKIVLKKKTTIYAVLPCITLINVINAFMRVKTIGITNILSRATNTGVSFSSYGSLSMLVSQIFQAVSYFSVAISMCRYKKNKTRIGCLIINVFCLLIAYFPTGLARYAAAVIYMGLFLTYFSHMRKNRVFILIFIGAFTVMLPFMNVFRNSSIYELELLTAFSNIVNNLTDVWKELDYDAYTIFTLSIENVDRYGAGGKHILSILFFWVPRAVWTSKALSGSYEMAHDRGLGFDNLSCPLPAEGMLDGGIAGLIIMGMIIGWLMEKVDSFYWRRADISEKITDNYDFIYPVVVIFWFFMCRGDMFYIFAYLVAYIVTWKMLVIASKIINKCKS